ncbi:MAG: glutaredoxin family protein [DPANN group archaeon]|nr:glutaredoxin family protein [DPANN group archaeon]
MDKKVKIYSTPYCTYCKLAKNFFTKNNVAFTEVDVSEDEKELNSMVKKSGQMGVPVIEIDDKVIVGYNEAKIKKLLGLK